jgi:hypothetical protein
MPYARRPMDLTKRLQILVALQRLIDEELEAELTVAGNSRIDRVHTFEALLAEKRRRRFRSRTLRPLASP